MPEEEKTPSFAYDLRDPDFFIRQKGQITDCAERSYSQRELIDTIIGNRQITFIQRQVPPTLCMICRFRPFAYRYLPHKYAAALLEEGEAVPEEELKNQQQPQASTYEPKWIPSPIQAEIQAKYTELKNGINDLGEKLEAEFKKKRRKYRDMLSDTIQAAFRNYAGYGCVVIVKEVWGCDNYWKTIDPKTKASKKAEEDDEVGLIVWPDVDRIMRIQEEMYSMPIQGSGRGVTLLLYDNKSPQARISAEKARSRAPLREQPFFLPPNAPEKKNMFAQIHYEERGDHTFKRTVTPEEYTTTPPTCIRLVGQGEVKKKQSVSARIHPTFDLDWLLQGQLLPKIQFEKFDLE